MSQPDEFEKPSPDSTTPETPYEKILRQALHKRTGRDFKRNIESAVVLKQDKEDHEEVASRIFENVLNRQIEQFQTTNGNNPADSELFGPSHEQDSASADEPSSELSMNYGEMLDQILWPGAIEGQDDEAGASAATAEAPADVEVLPAEPAQGSYQAILARTLAARTAPTPGRQGALRVEAAESRDHLAPAQPDPSATYPDHFSATLDELLGL